MTVSMGMLIFAGLGYALEKDEPGTMFYTLPQVCLTKYQQPCLSTLYYIIVNLRPQTLYWAIITMTSTGEFIGRFGEMLFAQGMGTSRRQLREENLLVPFAPSAG